jgi:hypothetical protein
METQEYCNVIQICTEATHFKDFEGKLLTQTDGTAIGKSMPGNIARIFMEFYDNEFVLAQRITNLNPYSGEER